MTEPRRVAAVSMARRVGQEMGFGGGTGDGGSEVAYQIRYDGTTSGNSVCIIIITLNPFQLTWNI